MSEPSAKPISGSESAGATALHSHGPLPTQRHDSLSRAVLLPCGLLFGAMFNLTLVVAGLKELVLDELGGTVTDASLFFSVEILAYILFAPIWGLASDRIGRRKPFIVTGFALSAVVYALYGLVTEVTVFLALRFLQGAFAVMGWSIVMAALLDHPRYGKQGRFMGLMGACLIFGVAVGAPFGGYLTRWFGARAPLNTASLLFALLAAAALLLHEGRDHQAHVTFRGILRALQGQPRLLLPMAFHFVDRLAVGLFVVIFPLYLYSLGAHDPAIRGRYLALFLLPFAFLQYWSGRIAERTGPYAPLLLGSFAYGLALTTVGSADLFLLWPVMIALGVFAAVMFPPAILLTSQLSNSTTRASAMGGFNLAGSIGFALGPLVGGWAYATGGYGLAFTLCGGLEIGVTLLAALRIWQWYRSGTL